MYSERSGTKATPVKQISLAATIGKLVKPTIRMHEEDWDGKQYTLYSTRIEPKGPEALPPPAPKDEFSIGNALKKEATIFAEYTGLYGFIAKSAARCPAPCPPRAAASTPTSTEGSGWDRPACSRTAAFSTSPGGVRRSGCPLSGETTH